MEDRLGDVLQCEEQLRSTLHSNDKEKLRRKLALLQKEYLRTVQRLKRAERVESVRQHVRSRIARHNRHDQTKADPEPPAPSAAEREGADGPRPGAGHKRQQRSPGVTKTPEKRAQAVRFSLASDTPNSGSDPDSARVPKTSSALRLRSRRSRLRLAERSAESDQSAANSQEAPRSSRRSADGREKDTARLGNPPGQHESEELFSPSENESPSLLLPHWNLQGRVERDETLTREKGKDGDENPPNPDSLPHNEVSASTNNVRIHAHSHKHLLTLNDTEDANDEKEEKQQPTPEKEVSNGDDELSLLEAKDVSPHNGKHKMYSKLEDVYENGKHPEGTKEGEEDGTANHRLAIEEVEMVSNCEEKMPNFAFSQIETKVSPLRDSHKLYSKLEDVDENGKRPRIQRGPTNAAEVKAKKTEPEDGGQRLLDSCTLVDGLLFPAEYYVRTTRRMSVLQSQPDMNAVILSHLHKGRQRRGRGRGRRLNRTVSEDGSVLEASKDVPENNGPSPCEFFSGLSASLDAGSVSASPTASRGPRGRGGRGRGRGRGRGHARGRAKGQARGGAGREDDVKENLTEPQTNGLCVALRAPEFVEPESDEVPPEDAGDAASGVTAEEAQTWDAQENDPVIRQTDQRGTNGEQERAAPDGWPDLLLPSSSQGDHPALSSPLPPIPLFKKLLGSDVRDFHLPDDQFGALKLLKLRQIFSELEQLTSTSNTAATTDQRARSPALSPSPRTPTPETYLEQVPGSPSQVFVEDVDSNEGESVSNQKLVGCSGSSSMSSPKYKNGTNIVHFKDQTPPLNVQDCEGSAVERGKEQRKPVTNGASLPENRAQNEDKGGLKNSNTESSSLKTDNQTRSHQILPKNTLSSPKKPAENSENIQMNAEKLERENNQTETEKVETEETNLPRLNPSRLLLSPSLGSAPPSLALPPLGVTPRPVEPAASSVPPLLRSPASEALSLPPSLLLTPPAPAQEASLTGNPRSQQEAQAQRGGEEAGDATCALKGGAGLVDVCCISSSSSGALSVAAARTWAVDLWSEDRPSDWSLKHTWTFEDPVLGVFSIPDTPDHFCLTLGRPEIRQVRVLSCSTLSQTVLCTGPAHITVAAPGSRVVCCFHTPAYSRLRVYTLSETSPPQVCALVSPGALLSSLAPVEGLPDALIGMDQSGALFIWNMASGRVLKRLTLRETFSRSLCIRGYSSHGALFVLMQQQQMQGSVQGPGAEAEQEQTRLSLVAMNPLNGKSVLVTDLCVPDQWSGRRSAVTAVDVLGSLLLGLSDEGGVCVWDLERPTDPRPVCAPGGRRGWHVARWGAPGLLLTALNAGDVTLHRYAHGTATVMLTLTHPD